MRAGRPSVVIAPMLHAANWCDEASAVEGVSSNEEAARFCARIGANAAARIESALDRVGPRISPSGKYAMGYALPIPLFQYLVRDPGGWRVDRDGIKVALSTVIDIERPAVLYISSNHFTDVNTELVDELRMDPRNLMSAVDGPLDPGEYFGHRVVPWTLVDRGAPVSLLRETLIRSVAEELIALPAFAQERVVGVSILGEVHQLFPGFGTGQESGNSIWEGTDHSDASRMAFQDWLARTFGTVSALNTTCATDFGSFGAVSIPCRNGFGTPLRAPHLHWGPGAAGTVPIAGWFTGPFDGRYRYEIYCDGSYLGEAEPGLSRTDVTDELPMLNSANVGFRFTLRTDSLSGGLHEVEVRVVVGACQVASALRRIRIVSEGSFHVELEDAQGASDFANEPDLGQGHLDEPEAGSAFSCNPLAVLWQDFRSQVVREFLEETATTLMHAGVPKEIIFCHQPAATLSGILGGQHLAVDQSLERNSHYLPGVTLYGGSGFGEAFFRMKRRLGWGPYAVTEMHPCRILGDDTFSTAMDRHWSAGAVYLSPYFLPVSGDPTPGGLDRFRLDPANDQMGSNAFYRAIAKTMQDG